jgi:CRP-like cAMP-binding protein
MSRKNYRTAVLTSQAKSLYGFVQEKQGWLLLDRQLAQLFTSNRILARLSADDVGLLTPHLKPEDLPLHKSLEIPQKIIKHIYFPESGCLSVVADGPSGQRAEVGMIGREGMTGLAVVLGTSRSPNEAVVQTAGSALRISVDEFRNAMEQSASLRTRFARYAHAFLVQVSQRARTNARHKIEERVACWLLMVHDRLRTDDVTVTHEFLAGMLGVRRSSITAALGLLEKASLISTNRGVIKIADRVGLLRRANGSYGISELELDRLLGRRPLRLTTQGMRRS